MPNLCVLETCCIPAPVHHAYKSGGSGSVFLWLQVHSRTGFGAGTHCQFQEVLQVIMLQNKEQMFTGPVRQQRLLLFQPCF